ncbi:hypothetical protein Clacol_000959 [Clathrus columnatus]|uniref:Uncharacterized protein n=1 Tax=Clathrus columnatus TaxID=1419009 RepID=A0AAV5A2A4_9AGAM|nr:hypothetical protein Clacol_000959 [Clathrus columnatus]
MAPLLLVTSERESNMSLPSPQLPPAHASEAAKFLKEFGEKASNFTKVLQLPSAIDSSVMAYKSKTAAFYVKDLENSKLVRPFVKDIIESAIEGLSITVNTSEIINDLTKIFTTFVIGAKVTPTFGNFSSTSYRGTYFDTPAIYKVLLAVYIADVSKLYDANPKSVVELAYYTFLTAQRAD